MLKKWFPPEMEFVLLYRNSWTADGVSCSQKFSKTLLGFKFGGKVLEFVSIFRCWTVSWSSGLSNLIKLLAFIPSSSSWCKACVEARVCKYSQFHFKSSQVSQVLKKNSIKNVRFGLIQLTELRGPWVDALLPFRDERRGRVCARIWRTRTGHSSGNLFLLKDRGTQI